MADEAARTHRRQRAIMGSSPRENATSNTTGAADGLDIVRLSDEQRAVELLGRSVLGLWEAVNNLSRLRPDAARRVPRHDLRLRPHRRRCG